MLKLFLFIKKSVRGIEILLIKVFTKVSREIRGPSLTDRSENLLDLGLFLLHGLRQWNLSGPFLVA
jgi:hypothetical protein